LGGRYCSIQGGLAAQLKLRDRGSGELYTLYANSLTPDLEADADTDIVYDYVGLTLGHRRDVFFALAGSRTPRAWPPESD
ncbi:MAG: hypothetical protein OXC11_14500, partial [Rhodospirillales bacterium]|nr:hypothetical protein [Rhodospirillales bacterium]